MKMSTVWIDTCGSFDLRRIEQMLKERTLDMEVCQLVRVSTALIMQEIPFP